MIKAFSLFLLCTTLTVSNVDCQEKLVEDTDDFSSALKYLVYYKKPNLPTLSTLNKVKKGFVRVHFNVNKEGKANNIKIVSSNPERVFDVAVTSSLKGLKFLYTPDIDAKELSISYFYEPKVGLYIR